MGRQPRAEFQNALYHVFARGNRREPIFLDDEDYQAYLNKLRELSHQSGVDVLAYCLMPNHPHLCLRTRGTPLSAFMHRLNTAHARRFNRKYNVRGHLHEGRYRSVLVEERVYLLRLVRYIHQNPTRAGLVKTLREWPYSSYGEYRAEHTWVRREPALSAFETFDAFEAFESTAPGEQDLELFSRAPRAFAFAGSEEGTRAVAERIREECKKSRLLWVPLGGTTLAPSSTLEPIAQAWLESSRCPFPLAALRGPARHEPLRSYRRALAAFLREQRFSLRSIAMLLDRQVSAITKLARQAQ